MSSRLHELMDQSNLLSEEGRHEEAIELALAAWALLPQPQAEHEDFGWVVESLIASFFDLQRYDEAEQWARVFLSGKEADNLPVGDYFWLGKICFEQNRLEEARHYFQLAYAEDPYAFEDEPKKYRQFFKQAQAGQGG
ncbi:tetratricopeptide (TPR) repeat protein [Neisseria sp. HSC-16F19]|nr:tetratricopeptide repeat protein [Neisseria sp. HSC-16F19]MCP2040882.1 tetratricopeptide (TPR) repeat protein [Neisseria sp. HSC-16F19]